MIYMSRIHWVVWGLGDLKIETKLRGERFENVDTLEMDVRA